jgi:hypothetical protein
MEFVRKSRQQRWLGRASAASFLILPLLVVDGFLREEAVKQDYITLRSEDPLGKPEAVKALVKGCKNLQSMPDWSHPVGERVFGTCRTLRGQDLAKTDLRVADLRVADLRVADLRDADLSVASLSYARGLTQEQLTEARLCKTELPSEIKLDLNRDCKAFGITP